MPLKKQTDIDPKATGNSRPDFGGVSLLPVITASGFSAAVAQIVLLRELMVLCYGIELCMGAILAAWLIGNAIGCGVSAGMSRRGPPKSVYPGLLLILAALVLPLTLLLVRAAGPIWGIVPGEMPPLARLLQICIAATFPFSFVSGALFGLCWAMMKNAPPVPLSIYVGEALGAAAGGILFYLLMIAHQTALTVVLITASLLVITAAWFFKTGHAAGARPWAFVLAGFCAICVAGGFIFRGDLDLASRRLQWGPDFVAAEDTPYQNLAMLHKGRQFSVFANGLWLFSTPDQPTREFAVHPALLQHPDPASVLLLGGAQAGLVEEILRHPSVRHIDVVELDPALTVFSAAHIPETFRGFETGGAVTLHFGDAAEFVRTSNRHYDVILMNVGDPINAQMNRFYTASFFKAVKRRLTPDGIFSFGVSGGEDMLGEVQIGFLGTIRRTLAQIFADVSVLPGDTVRFFAANDKGRLITDPEVLIDRIRQRGLDLSYVREDTLRDRFETFRFQYFNSVLTDTPEKRINRDFTPLCYAHALRLWTAQWHSRIGNAVASLTRLRAGTLWTLLLLACGLTVGFFRVRQCRPQTAVCLSVATVGGLTIGVQMVLLIVFQIMEGALFLHLALIVALFMAGLAGGAGWMSARSRAGGRDRPPGKRLIRVQAALCIFPAALAGLFLLIHGPFQPGPGSGLPVFLFSGLSLISGILGGAHFAAASATMAVLGHPVSGIGGRLYACDLVGASGGLILSTFLAIPALGPVQLLPMFSAAAAAGLVILYGRV